MGKVKLTFANSRLHEDCLNCHPLTSLYTVVRIPGLEMSLSSVEMKPYLNVGESSALTPGRMVSSQSRLVKAMSTQDLLWRLLHFYFEDCRSWPTVSCWTLNLNYFLLFTLPFCCIVNHYSFGNGCPIASFYLYVIFYVFRESNKILSESVIYLSTYS